MASAQDTVTVQGVVTDPTGAVVTNAPVVVLSSAATVVRSTVTDRFGRYRITDLPHEPFSLRVTAKGFAPAEVRFEPGTAVSLIGDIQLSLVANVEQITVSQYPLVDVDSASSHHDFTSKSMDRTAFAVPHRQLTTLVKQIPGVVEEENGRIHIRGSEAQPQYVLDGVPIADNVSGMFGTELDAENIRTAEVITGNIPASFGDKANAIINISTKSGLDAPWRGAISFSAGSFSSTSGGMNVGGHVGKLGVYLSAETSRSSRFLDPPDPGKDDDEHKGDAEELEELNVHNRGAIARLFTRLDWLRSD